MNDVDTGALGPSGRFARMEAALDRIELKLDLKADTSRVVELEVKQQALEQLIADMASGKHISPLSAMYLERFNQMEKSIEKMETEDSNRAAVLLAAKEVADSRYIRLSWVVGGATIFNILVNLIPWGV